MYLQMAVKPLFTSMASNIIDLEDSRVFHASEWIGIGKTYPEDIQYIKDAKKELLSILQLQHDYLPPSELLVAQFVVRSWRASAMWRLGSKGVWIRDGRGETW